MRQWVASHDRKWTKDDANHWIKDPMAHWTPVHSRVVLKSLTNDVFPELGGKPIAQIRPMEVMAILEPIQDRGAIETAHRTRQRISAVFVHGMALGFCEQDPAASLANVLKKKPKVRNQPSIMDGLDDQEERLKAVRKLLEDVEATPSRAQNQLAMRLMALTAVRSTAFNGAKWTEFRDLGGSKPTWVIPASRMKGPKEQKMGSGADFPVPLSRQAVEVIDALRRLTGQYRLCFPSDKHLHRPISENTLREMLIRAGYYKRHVPHGFRAAFSTFMNERAVEHERPWDQVVIDLMLGHMPANCCRFDGHEVKLH